MEKIKDISYSLVSKLRSKARTAMVLGVLMQCVFWGSYLYNDGTDRVLSGLLTSLQYTLVMSVIGVVIAIRGWLTLAMARSISSLALIEHDRDNYLNRIQSTIDRTINVCARIDGSALAGLLAVIAYIWLYSDHGFVPDWRGLLVALGAIGTFLLLQIVTRSIQRKEYGPHLDDLRSIRQS